MRNWLALPWWLLSPLTGAKSFVGNPILGSERLNRLGLHAARVRVAHALASYRRRRLARHLPAQLRQQFDQNGFVVVRDFLPEADFTRLRDRLLTIDVEARTHQQGDTLTARVAIGPRLLRTVPELASLLTSRRLAALLGYVASAATRPLFYLQSIRTGLPATEADPQQDLHADTFHPSMKAWLFLNHIGEDEAPLTYVAGSHRLTPARLAWEKERSVTVLRSGGWLSQRGSFRVPPGDLATLGLEAPIRFVVPANTLVIIDTCGFHARGRSQRPCVRSEIWAYSRRSPFLPWTGVDIFSALQIGDRRSEWLAMALDWLDRKGWARQHWTPAGAWRDHLRLPADVQRERSTPLAREVA